jgi:hypothetical protein
MNDIEITEFEKDLREQIVKKIEAYVLSDDTSEHYKLALPVLRATFAAIVKGEVEK